MIVVDEQNHTPLVSVLMTAYNREKFIAESIESVLSSTFSDWELIITDDCSSDKTLNIALEYANKDSRIKVYKNEKNLGDYNNRNKAASYAEGKYLKYLDSDDIIFKHTLELMVSSMENFPDAGFALSLITDNSPKYLAPIDIIRSEYLDTSYLGVGPSASIIKKEAFASVGGFSGKQYIGDTELWLKLSSNFPMIVLGHELLYWREHPQQQMQSELKKPQILIDRLNLSLFFLKENKEYFSHGEYGYAIKRKKQHFSRMILSNFFYGKNIYIFFYLVLNSKLNIFDWFAGFKRYYK